MIVLAIKILNYCCKMIFLLFRCLHIPLCKTQISVIPKSLKDAHITSVLGTPGPCITSVLGALGPHIMWTMVLRALQA